MNKKIDWNNVDPVDVKTEDGKKTIKYIYKDERKTCEGCIYLQLKGCSKTNILTIKKDVAGNDKYQKACILYISKEEP